MAGSSTPWGSSYRLVAADKWKAKSAAMGGKVTQALVDYAHPAPGMKVLDLAAGTGEPGISIARIVGPAGHVTASDLSVELLEVATQRAQSKGLDNFSTQQADAHQLPFPDHSFDLATCRFGVMFFRNPAQALAELHRVLKPEARACFVVWGPFEQPYWQATMKIVMRYGAGSLTELSGSDPFCFSQPGSLAGLMRAAGFHDIDESPKNVPWIWPGEAAELFEYATSVSAPFRPMLERIPAVRWPEMHAESVAAIARHSAGGEIRFGVDLVFVSGKA